MGRTARGIWLAFEGTMKPAPRVRDVGEYAEILDRLLDRGIVIDESGGVLSEGVTVVGKDSRLVVISVETFVEVHDRIGSFLPLSGDAVRDSLDGPDPHIEPEPASGWDP